MPPRKAISKKRRFEVFKRDGFICQYCGSHPPSVILHVDHIVPVKEGGGNEEANLITSCQHCNLGKSATPLSDVPQSLKDRAEEVREREEQIRGYSAVMAAMRDRIDDEAWEVAEVFTDHFSKDGIRKDWLNSIRMFVEKLGAHDCIRAMELATGRIPYSENQCFRYFCGACWGRIREAE